MNHATQLLGLSNAIVDILGHVKDEFLTEIGAAPGSMTLIDADRAKQIYAKMGPATEMSGGSVSNTVAGFANLGGKAAYIGRVADDQFGAIFNHDMMSLGVDMRLPPETRGAPTALSYVLITPDGQRTMQTYLGACTEISVTDITEKTIGKPEALLIEGYIYDTPEGPAVVEKAMSLAKKAGSAIALSLSDSGCVERHHDAFVKAFNGDVGIVFANEAEMQMLFATDNFDHAVKQASKVDGTFVVTRSEHGSVVINRNERHNQTATPIDELVDTTGAGDAYTAGYLYGWANKKPVADCARLGSRCASAVIQQIGARIEKGALIA